ncbi:MAG: DinB family protein [Gemmatimonadaceae bacterium]
MHPLLKEITDDIARIRVDLTRLVDGTPRATFDHPPRNGGWTGTGIIQHLGTVEGMATKMLEGLFSKALADGLAIERGTASWLHALDRHNVLDRSRPITAPERAHPPADAKFETAWSSLHSVRQRLLAAIATVDGRDISSLSAPHPVFGPLNGYEWIHIIGRHEERHLSQLRETLSEA